VVSVFVNPAQFGEGEDLESYPVDLRGDMGKCAVERVDCVFAPAPSAMYPAGFQTYVDVTELSQGLCGARRPGHFRGVATVVTKLFNMVGPCSAVFGEKDYQQLQVIRRMVTDLNLPVEVVGAPIVRESDGLAMSSRNAYLRPDQREAATSLFRGLSSVKRRLSDMGPGSTLPAREAVDMIRSVVEAAPGTRIDYIEVRDAETLQPAAEVGGGQSVLALAVFVGQTRLIDNMVL
jgi:pantoate--beta-alanine ligase